MPRKKTTRRKTKPIPVKKPFPDSIFVVRHKEYDHLSDYFGMYETAADVLDSIFEEDGNPLSSSDGYEVVEYKCATEVVIRKMVSITTKEDR